MRLKAETNIDGRTVTAVFNDVATLLDYIAILRRPVSVILLGMLP